MSFTEGLSGLNAASEQLSVLSKNIANSATVGYKSSSIDFTNVLASHLNSANSGSGVQTGGAVLASNVMQSFTQGAINSNNTPLNAAISGQGMFVMYDPTLGQTSYTRNGQFTQNSAGLLVNSSGFEVLDISSAPIDLSTYQINPDSSQTYQVDTVVFSKPLSPYGTVTFGGLTYTNTDGNTIGTVVAPTINSTTTGTSLLAEVDSAAFNEMSAGDSVTVGGLRFVANQDLTASQAADAFASLTAGATTGPSTSYGSYSGKFSSAFTSGANSSGTVVFAATSAGVQSAIAASAVQSGVAAIFSGLLAGDTPTTIAARSAASVANGGAANYALTSGIFSGVLGDFDTSSPAASTTVSTDVLTTGTAAVTQIETLTFSAINTGDTYSAGGLTFTATSDITAAELAASFYSKINDSTSTSIYGTWSGTVTSGSGGATGLGSATMNGTTAVDWSYAGNGVVSTGLISGLWTTSGMPSSYLGVNLSASELANDAAVTVTHINYGSETAIAVTGSGFLSGSNPFVKTTTAGTDTAYLNTMAIDSTGTIIGTYTDGSTYTLGQLGVALIPSNAGLKALGNDSWIETDKSGVPVIAAANTLGRGTIVGSALEASNVNQTTDMVGLLAAQQAYQASAQVIKLEGQDYQTLIGMNG
ncbi:flagellar hook-basal body complex protein [Polynucleobacter paneuropaeus]|nr:flagellar hook-basal body complex protein [Polynucleobacter paneuropaeus]